MKQVLLNRESGSVEVVDVPDVSPGRGQVLVRNEASVISAGTESAHIETEARSVFQRIVEKPALIKKGLDLIRDHGLSAVRDQMRAKLQGYSPLGYSCAGVVIATGEDVTGFNVGQRVACGGAGWANHAEFVCVPANLCAVVPDGVEPEAAAYATMGAIALHGIRQSCAVLGEYVAVIGLGAVGLLTVQLLKAAGCHVIGVDMHEAARQRGMTCGCRDVAAPETAEDAMTRMSKGIGADAIIICAAAKDSAPIELAARLARSRGRIVMVGSTGMTLPREIFFRKELSFSLSRSYGPGRYDRAYEEEGHDYPVDYVRFTEQRNMQCFIDLVKRGDVDPALITTHRFTLADAPSAYALLREATADRAGIVLTYPVATDARAAQTRINVSGTAPVVSAGKLGISFIGAGDYATRVLLPILKERSDIELRGVATRTGSNSLSAATRFGFAFAASGAADVLADPDCQIVFIATHHDSHAQLVLDALKSGKHVWVEKPLSLTLDELRKIEAAVHSEPHLALMVGFNRRFSPLAVWLKKSLSDAEPMTISYRVNAGSVSSAHWTKNPAEGGGRLLGEGCHFFDFLCYMASSEPLSVSVQAVRSDQNDTLPTENFSAQVTFRNGSVGSLVYSAMGSPRLPKERIEIFKAQRSAVLDDFTRATIYTMDRHDTRELHHQDKGQRDQITQFLAALRTGQPCPVSCDALIQSSLLTLAAQRSLERQQPVLLSEMT